MTDDRANRIAALFAELADLVADHEPTDIPAPRQGAEHALLTAEEAAERLHIGRTRMFTLLKTGEIESVLIGRSRRINPDAIDAYTRRLQDETKTWRKT